MAQYYNLLCCISKKSPKKRARHNIESGYHKLWVPAVMAQGCQDSRTPTHQELGKLDKLTVLVPSQEVYVGLPIHSLVVLYDSSSNINIVI